MTRIFVKPTLDTSPDAQPGARLKVRKPVGGHLAEAGEWQNLDSYWQRRINDKDVSVDKDAVEETEQQAVPTGAEAGSSGKSTGKTK